MTTLTQHNDTSNMPYRAPLDISVLAPPGELMSATQAGRVLGVSAWCVRKLFRDGALSGFQPGDRGRVRVTKQSVLALRATYR